MNINYEQSLRKRIKLTKEHINQLMEQQEQSQKIREQLEQDKAVLAYYRSQLQQLHYNRHN